MRSSERFFEMATRAEGRRDAARATLSEFHPDHPHCKLIKGRIEAADDIVEMALAKAIKLEAIGR